MSGIRTRAFTEDERRRIALHIALIPVYVWLVFAWTSYAIDVGTPGRLDRSGHLKGHDFLHFYVLGQMGLERRPQELYDFDAHAARTDRLVPEYEHHFMPVHAPQVALFFAPPAALPYLSALALWLSATTLVYAACVFAWFVMLPPLRPFRGLVAVLALAFPPFYSLIAAGQTSAFALAWLTGAYAAMRASRPWLAGAAFGMLAYKPTLLLLIPVALAISRDWRVLGGLVLAAGAQLVIAAAYWGPAILVEYVHGLRAATGAISMLEARPEQMHSLKAFFDLLLPSAGLAASAYATAALVVAAVTLRAWISDAPLQARYACLLAGSLLVNPHVYRYELVLAAPVLMSAAASWLALGAHGPRWLLIYACYLLPSLDATAAATRVQASVPALLALVVLLARRRGTTAGIRANPDRIHT